MKRKPTYKALVCGHLVHSPNSLRCRGCYELSRADGVVDGYSYTRTDGYRVYRRGKTQRLEHRVVMERVLERPLRTDEHVHHINMNRGDNRPENLLVCSLGYNTWLVKRYAELFASEKFDGQQTESEGNPFAWRGARTQADREAAEILWSAFLRSAYEKKEKVS